MIPFIQKRIFADKSKTHSAPYVLLVIIAYMIISSAYMLFTFGARSMLIRVINNALIAVIFILLERSRLSVAMTAFLSPTIMMIVLLLGALISGGDSLTFIYVNCAAMISLTYFSKKGLTAHIITVGLGMAFLILGLNINLLGAETFPMSYNYKVFAGTMGLNALIYSFCLFSIRMIEALDRHKNLLSMESNVAETLLTSSGDIDIETVLIDSVELIARVVDADHAQIWRNAIIDGELCCVNEYRWVSERGCLGDSVPVGMTIKYKDRPGWEDTLARSDYINLLLPQMTPDTREFLIGYNIKSLLVIPINVNGRIWGFLSIADCRNERIFSDDEINILRNSAMLITNALLRDNMMQDMEEALKKANTASRAKTDFLANMSHEIRTPMNAIIGMTALGKAASDTVRKDYSFKKIEDASNHLLGVINDILDMSKIESGKFELSAQEFSFERMLQRVANVVNYKIIEKNQYFKIFVDRDIPEFLFGDDQRLAQVITNLVGNAIKFTPEGGVIKIGSYYQGEADEVCDIKITVSDTGIGISPEQQSRLFQSFQQADSSTSRKFGGTGLGLAISKSVVEKMGGSIWVESEVGKGSTFSFTVKLGRRDVDERRLLGYGVNWERLRIMVIEDDTDILAFIKKIAREFGAVCDTARSGKDALEQISQNGGYDVYFLGQNLPDVDGVDLIKTIMRNFTHESSPAFAMFADMLTRMSEDDAKEAGVDAIVIKPYLPSNIVDAINDMLGLKIKLTEDASVEEDISFEGHRILLAEDVEINREIVLAMLEPTGLVIDCAENGAEVLKMFKRSPDKYDMIFMDVQMPEMDGYEATRAIRETGAERGGTIPIIAMTANVFREDVIRCREAGMNGHLGKPLDFNDVLLTLKKHL